MKILKKIKAIFESDQVEPSPDHVGLVQYKGKYYRTFGENEKGIYLENTKTRRKIHVKNEFRALILGI